MEVKSYFFDSYVFYEIIEGNLAFKKYTEGIGIITTRLNLMELHYGLLSLYGKEVADEHYNALLEFVIDIDDSIIKQANEFKFNNKKKKLSYVDCIGYTIAKKRNVKFLTGDVAFEDLDNVEFVL